MTVKELKAKYENLYVGIEVYRPFGIGEHYPNHFHTDNCRFVDDYSEDEEVGLCELMSEKNYDRIFCGNCCVTADFYSWYGNRDAKILCLMLAE